MCTVVWAFAASGCVLSAGLSSGLHLQRNGSQCSSQKDIDLKRGLMSLRPWKKLSQSTVCRNPYWEYRCDDFELPNGKRGQYHYVHTQGAALIIPVAADGRLHLVKQYRYLLATESLEFPCGGVREGVSFEHTARAELAEEAGLTAGKWTDLGVFCPFNGVADELCRVYLAEELGPTEAMPDETEEFEQVLLAPSQMDELVAEAKIIDGMTLAGWALVRSRFR